jgi:hypothetical protein
VIICCLPLLSFAAASRAVDQGNDRAVSEERSGDAEVTVIVEALGLRRKAAAAANLTIWG